MKKQFWFFKVAILVLYISTAAFSQWERQNSGVNVALWDVCFVDSLHGWAVGDSATIIATADGGKHWIQQNNLASKVHFEKVFFIDQNIGYVIGDSGTILITKDGGQNWMKKDSGTDRILSDLSFINADTGWVVGYDWRIEVRNGFVLQTTDGGQIWRKLFETAVNSWQMPVAIEFINAREGWAFVGGYFDNFSSTNIYQTYDGGEHWNIISEVRTPLREMSIVPHDTVWAGRFGFVTSTDGGRSWNYKFWPITEVMTIVDIDQIDGKTGWLTTSALRGNQIISRIIHTEDGGNNWIEILGEQSPLLIALANWGKSNLWAVGDLGIILHFKNKPVAVQQPFLQLPQTFRLEQNHPNPFKANTTIEFSLLKGHKVILTIYDLTGKAIAVPLSQTLEGGNYTVSWDGRSPISGQQLSTGIYFYELRIGNSNLRKKMILLR